jgi:hypothetical protein
MPTTTLSVAMPAASRRDAETGSQTTEYALIMVVTATRLR